MTLQPQNLFKPAQFQLSCARFFLRTNMFSTKKMGIAVSVFVSVLAGCGSGIDSNLASTAPPAAVSPAPAPGPSPTPAPAPAPVPTIVSGKVVAPDKQTPISNALVYIENSAIASSIVAQSIAGVGKETLPCGAAPNASWAATCSGSDGQFSLKAVLPADAKIVVSKGAFKQEAQLAAGSGGTLNAGSIAFAVGNVGNAVKMAVVTGLFDRIEDILARLGFGELEQGRLKLGTERFTLYDGIGGASPNGFNSADLFLDRDKNGRADIYDYQIVFWNCGLTESILTPANIAILKDYVERGGRLYVSDLAYDLVEQTFPAYIDFYDSDTVAANDPEVLNAAQRGVEGVVAVATLDPQLRVWLAGVTCNGGSCLNPDGTANISGFLSDWALINQPHTANLTNVRVWANAPIAASAAPAAGTPIRRPLTLSFATGLGRVTYTSYHNESAVDAELTVEQRILQYLVFEL
jgi:hypothetical protein